MINIKTKPFGIYSCYRNILSLNLRQTIPDSTQKKNPSIRRESFGDLFFDHFTGAIRVQPRPSAPIPLFLSAPLMVSIAVTGRCNLHCQHCYPTIRKSELSLPLIENLIEELHEMGVFALSISGGEPLLHHDIETIITHGSALGFHLTLFTNGLLLSEQKAYRLKELGLNELNISLDAVDETQHDQFRGVSGAFSKSLKAIKYSLAAGITTWITCTVSNAVQLRAVDFARLANDLGVNKMRLVEVVNTGNANKNGLRYDINWSSQIDEVIDYLKEVLGYEIQAADYFNFPASRGIFRTNIAYSPFGCGAGTLRARITADGHVLGCPFLSMALPIQGRGSVRPDSLYSRSFADIWASSPYLQVIRDSPKNVEGMCHTCEHNLAWCRAGCRTEAFIQKGHLHASDPLCTHR